MGIFGWPKPPSYKKSNEHRIFSRRIDETGQLAAGSLFITVDIDMAGNVMFSVRVDLKRPAARSFITGLVHTTKQGEQTM